MKIKLEYTDKKGVVLITLENDEGKVINSITYTNNTEDEKEQFDKLVEKSIEVALPELSKNFELIRQLFAKLNIKWYAGDACLDLIKKS